MFWQPGREDNRLKVALTFDDGPSAWTEAILAHLAAHDAKASFFVVGASITSREDTLRHIHEQGHLIGNHSLTHPHLPRLTDDEIRRELADTQERIAEVVGQPPTLWRAPYFDLDLHVRAVASSLGLTHVGRTVDPGDWSQRRAAKIASHIADRAAPGSIVDLHDGIPPDGGTGTSTRQPTVDATELILKHLSHAKFVRVDEL